MPIFTQKSVSIPKEYIIMKKGQADYKGGVVMAVVFVTGLSGVGTSSALAQMAKEGYNTVDTDYGFVKEIDSDGTVERVWDEERIYKLLEAHKDSHLFISGCYSNQGKFYNHFAHVVLLKADLNVMLDRVEHRTTNNYGKSPGERSEIIASYENVLPLLMKSSDIIIDTTKLDVQKVCKLLKALL